ncbi:MAG: hypothetical protein WD425_11750, partial [Nitrospirales bacterium]
ASSPLIITHKFFRGAKKFKTVLEKMNNTPTLPNTASPPTLSTPKATTKDTPADPPTQMSLF